MLSKEFRKDCFLMSGRQEREFDISRRLVLLEKKVEALIQEIQSSKTKQAPGFIEQVVAQCKPKYMFDIEVVFKDNKVVFPNVVSDYPDQTCRDLAKMYQEEGKHLSLVCINVQGENISKHYVPIWECGHYTLKEEKPNE